MQTPLPGPPAQSTMYHPPQQAMLSGGLFSLHKFLMIGVILILLGTFVSLLPDFGGEPSQVDYDTEEADWGEKFAEDTESHNDFERVMNTIATILGTGGVALIGYAFIREAYDEDTTTPALRITLLILGAVMLLQLLGSGFDVSVSV